DKTGAGMLDCKKALGESNGDLEAAVDWLRKKGLAAAQRKSGRVAAEGLVGVIAEGTHGAVVEVNTETDFVARNDSFQDLVREVTKIALNVGGDIENIKAAQFPGGSTVGDKLANLIGTIGENMTLRRSSGLSVEKGAVASYVHSAVS